MPRLQSAIEQVRLYGLRGVYELLQSNLCDSTHCLRLRKDLHDFPIRADHPSGSLHVERADIGHLEAWRRRRPGLPVDFFADRTHGLTQCYLGYWNDAIAHILWAAGKTEASTVSGWAVQAGEVELRNVTTLPEFRRKGIFQEVLRRALADLRGRGIRTAYAHVDEHNHASLQGFVRLGFRATHRVAIVRVLGMDRVREAQIVLP